MPPSPNAAPPETTLPNVAPLSRSACVAATLSLGLPWPGWNGASPDAEFIHLRPIVPLQKPRCAIRPVSCTFTHSNQTLHLRAANAVCILAIPASNSGFALAPWMAPARTAGSRLGP